MEYDVHYLWKGDIAKEQERAIDWLESHGENTVAAYVTDGRATATLSSLERIAEFARDLGVTVVRVERVEEEESLVA